MDEHAFTLADLNRLESHRVFLGQAERGEYVERKDVAIACCGLPIPNQNLGFLKPPYTDVARTVAEVGAYFRGRGFPYRIVHSDRAPGCAEALTALGWTRDGAPVPVMTLATPREVPEPPRGLRIERVRDAAQLAAFRETAFASFGYPVEGARLFLTERALALPIVRAFVGRVDGVAVASSLALATGGVSGIYWVGTLAAARRRGYGEALTWAAVASGRELAAPLTVLQASEQGQPIYERMGFARTHGYQYWAPPESK